MTPDKPTIAEVRALAREEGSSLLDDASDEQIDAWIRQNIGRPAVTPGWLASMASGVTEFDALCKRLRAAIADGSVLDSEPADDKAMRAFRRAVPPPADHPAVVRAIEASGQQIWLARRLLTLATDIVIETGADLDPPGRALAVGAALGSVAAFQTPMARSVIDAMPADEWAVLREARHYAWMWPALQQQAAAE